MQNLTKEQLNKYVSELTNMAEIVVFEKLMCEDHNDTIHQLDLVYNHGCGVGVKGFIYYDETEAFFHTFSIEILDLLQELKEEYGGDMLDWFDFNKNSLTWLFVEITVRKMVESLGLDF